MPPPERECCPKCNSNDLFRHNTGTKRCVKCGHIIKQQPSIPGPNPILSNPRIERIKEVHEANNNYTKKQLIAFVPETRYMVDKYWSDPSMNITTVIE